MTLTPSKDKADWSEFHRIMGDAWLRDSGLSRDRDKLVAYVELALAEDRCGGCLNHLGDHLDVQKPWNEITVDDVRRRAREMPLDDLVTSLCNYDRCEW